MSALNWCEIYVDGKISCKELADEVIQRTNAKVRFTDGFSSWDLDLPVASLSVEKNDDSAWWRKKEASGFLYFPLKITAQQNDSSVKAEYESLIREIARLIRALGLRLSAVSDFSVDDD